MSFPVASQLGRIAIELRDLVFWAEQPDTAPPSEGGETAYRKQVNAWRLSFDSEDKFAPIPGANNLSADDLNNRLTRTRSEALGLITMMLRDGRWGVPCSLWNSSSDREAVERLVKQSREYSDLSTAIQEANNMPKGTGSSQLPTPPVDKSGAKTEAILPAMLSSSDIANRIGRNRESVNSFLTRFTKRHPDCRVENQTRRKNEPGYLYRTADVWAALEKWMKDDEAN